MAFENHRTLPNNLCALLHFDFPYFGEDNSGCQNEFSTDSRIFNYWTPAGDVKFVSENNLPCNELISGTPKFGYRCVSFSGANSYLSTASKIPNMSDDGKSLDYDGNYEIEFFIRPAQFGNYKILEAGSLVISMDSNGKLIALGATGGQLVLNSWQYVLIRIAARTLKIFINANEILSTNWPGTTWDIFKIGGFYGQLDELAIWNATRNTVKIPTQPYQGIFNLSEIGKFGNASLGDVVISSSCTINSNAIIKSVSGNNCTVSDWKNSAKFGAPKVGDEVLIHCTLQKSAGYNYVGYWEISRIAAISGNIITLEKKLETLRGSIAYENHYMQIITIPNFKNFTLAANATINPNKWNTETGGGIVAFKASGDCVINGKILAADFGPVRLDDLQMTHSRIVDRFIINRGGGIFIAAKKFSAPSSARIGGDWEGTPGIFVPAHLNGGAGYGGAGGWNSSATGGASLIGGGGGSGYGSQEGGAPGSYPLRTGGTGYLNGNLETSLGGSQNQPNPGGGNAPTPSKGVGSGGGGAGGNGGDNYEYPGVLGGSAGTNLILFAKTLQADAAAISTGGQFGRSAAANHYATTGGGGTGFCYIACKEMI